MARVPRQASITQPVRRLARAGSSLALAGALCLGLGAFVVLPGDVPLPSPVSRVEAAGVRLDKPSPPVRVRVPAAGVDLAVVSSERKVPGNPGDYPLCDVAQYWTIYDLPGAPGTAWIYAHAQPGMFLPLFTISEATDGSGLLGKIVEVQTRDKRLLRYRIVEVRERSTNRRIARRDSRADHRLILQTSTGPPGTVPKLQVAAELIDAQRATEPAPKAQPRACWQPRVTQSTPSQRNGSGRPRPTPTATAAPAEATDEGQPMDVLTLALGSGAVLLGTTLVAVYMVRRQP